MRKTEYNTESNTVIKHVFLTLVQNNTFYSRENAPVSAPFQGHARQMSGDMFKQNQYLNLGIQRIKTKLYLPNMPRCLRRPLKANKRRNSSLLTQPEVESESETQDENSRNKSQKPFPNRKPQTATPIPFSSPW